MLTEYVCYFVIFAALFDGGCNLQVTAGSDRININYLLTCFQVAHQQETVLVKNYFVPIFSICMALHCSQKSGWEKGAMVLQSSILSIADISDSERDKLVKKHMV